MSAAAAAVRTGDDVGQRLLLPGRRVMYGPSLCVCCMPPSLMRWLQLRFDCDSTGVRLLIRRHLVHGE